VRVDQCCCVGVGGLDHTIAYAGNVDGTLMGP